MQSLAVYSLDVRLDSASADARLVEIDQVIDSWLGKKGAIDPRVDDGTFESKSGDGLGQFSRRSIDTSIGKLREVELIETAHTGAMFTTVVQAASLDGSLAIWVSLSATPGSVAVAPMRLYRRRKSR